MNDEDAKKFYNAASSYEDIRIKTATMILLMTGMRRGELCGLEWDDVDLEEKNNLNQEIGSSSEITRSNYEGAENRKQQANHRHIR